MVMVIGKTNAEKQKENELEKFIEATKPLISKKEEISKGVLGCFYLKKKTRFPSMNSGLAMIDVERHKIYLDNKNYLELAKNLANTYESSFGGKRWVIKTQYE